MRFYLAALYRNLVAGTRLALFLPVRALDFRVSPLHYSLLLWAVVFGLAFPMSGLAIIGMVLIDQVLLRFVPALRRVMS